MNPASGPSPQALPTPQHSTTSTTEYLKVAFEAWPYVFMSVSVIGLIYVALSAIR
jgi:hypothetical protein